MSTPAEQLLAQLVGFDTTSRNSNRACIDFIRDYLDSFGVESEIIATDNGEKACLWATVGTGAVAVAGSAQGARTAEQSRPIKSGIALAGHTDVVPTDGQNWTSDPFTLTERDGKLYGRGAVDMKGFIACALAFVPEFLAANSGGCFHLALTCDEETDMSGALRLTDVLTTRNIRPEWVWVGEPTGFSIIDQHKGVSAYRTRITGVPGHSSQPDKGLNAIELAAQFMSVITDTARQKREKPFVPSRLDPPYTVFNLGTIEGGTAENIIAETCEVLWQMRAHPGDSAQEVMNGIENSARAALAPRMAAFAPQAKMETCTCFDIPPFLSLADNAGVRTLKKALKCEGTEAVGFATEAGIFQKTGAPAVVCGPGFIDQAHQPNEFIDKNQLSACVDLMRKVLLSSFAAK